MKDYFPHDYNARNDLKLQNLVMNFGQEGKGIYWDLIEMLYENGGYIMHVQCKCIAHAMHVEISALTDIIKTTNLFNFDDEKFWSESVLRRLKNLIDLKKKRQSAAQIKWKNAHALQASMQCNAIKVKESKVNKSKVNKEIHSLVISKKNDDMDYDFYLNLWNDVLVNKLNPITKLSTSRINKIKARLNTDSEFKKHFEIVINKILNNNFLLGDNKNNWKVSFDWIIENDKNYLKILEGNYDNKKLNITSEDFNNVFA